MARRRLPRHNPLRVYRQILRDLRTFLRDRHGIARPGGLTALTARGFLESRCEKNVSWSWMATAITVLRTAFDKLGRMAVTTRMVTPRRKWPLPETLSERELRLLLDALPNPRDRLLVALLAGCGSRKPAASAGPTSTAPQARCASTIPQACARAPWPCRRGSWLCFKAWPASAAHPTL